MSIRLASPTIEEDDLLAVCKVLETGYFIQGKQVADFEEMVANYVGVKYSIAVSNCTSALYLALMALNVASSDLVIVPSYSWPATANVVECCGAQPEFIDIQLDTFNMDPNQLEEKVKSLMATRSTAKKVKAIIPVHTFGQMADMTAITDIANRYDIPVIEDAACALGAKWNNKQAGSWGVMGCFSFHPRKAITTGEGGLITTNDVLLAKRIRCLRNHGQDPDSLTPDFIMPGYNMRMTEFQAALGKSQMEKINRIIHARRKHALVYDTLLKNSVIKAPQIANKSFSVYQSYVTLLPKELKDKRSSIIEKLLTKGIETSIGTWHIPLTTYYRTRYGYAKGNFPNTDEVFCLSLCLPMYENIQVEQQEYVVKSLLMVINE